MRSIVIVQSLEIMWKGMLSIFVVIAAIYIATLLISRIRKKNKENTEQ